MAILVKSQTDSTEKNRWGTTWQCFNDASLVTGYSFILDACAQKPTAKCAHYISPEEDAFKVDWRNKLSEVVSKTKHIEITRSPYKLPAVWCNPPFDDKLEFIDEAFRYSGLGVTTVMLLPWERTTNWWRDHVKNKAKRVFVPDGRYPFLKPDGVTKKSGVNFSSCFVEFSPSFFELTQYVDFEKSSIQERRKELVKKNTIKYDRLS